MNPGYLSYIAITLSVILMSFGWRAQAIGNASVRAALWFCSGWLLSIILHWELASVFAGTCVYVPLLALTVAALKNAPLRDTASVLSFSLLLGSVLSLIQLVEAIDPFVIVLHPILDPLLILCLLVVCYTRSPMLQFVMVSVSLVVNDSYMALMYKEWEHAFFGDRSFQDAWWMSVIAVRALTVFLSIIQSTSQRWISRLLGFLRVRR
jgi:hypothetical protein